MSHEYENNNLEQSHSGASTRNLWAPALGAGLLAVSCFSAYQFAETQDLRQEMAANQSEIQSLQKTLSGTDGEILGKIAELRQRVQTTTEEGSSALTKAQLAASRQNKALAERLEKQQQSELSARTEFESELSRMKDDASASLTGVKDEVELVRTNVASARTEVEKTLADLGRVRGDMGLMSGLVATNSKEIAALRELGDRAIFEFTLNKGAQMQRVGDVRVKLKKADAKRNRYTMEILADDKLVEKKDKNTNEPVQFYVTSKARVPYEIVVNDVSKNRVRGYLAAPKVSSASN